MTTKDGHFPLCHPNVGVDCYRLVTIWRHPLENCVKCTQAGGLICDCASFAVTHYYNPSECGQHPKPPLGMLPF